MLPSLHETLALAVVAVVVAGVAWSAGLALFDRPAGPAYVSFQAAVVAVIFTVAVSGLVLLALGHRPAEGLHFLYAAIGVGAIPLARSSFARARGRRAAVLMLAVFVVLAAVVFRLFASG